MLNERVLRIEGGKALRRYLEESGIRVLQVRREVSTQGRHADIELSVQLPAGKRRLLLVEFKANARRSPLENAVRYLRSASTQGSRNSQPVIFAPHLGRPMREWLRSVDVWFADLSGNRFFKAPGLLVDREVAIKQPATRENAPSVFADRSSLVLRYLLPRPAQKVGIRELARKLELSPAGVSGALKALEEMGYLERHAGELRLVDREGLLKEWVSFYGGRFRRQPESRFYVHAKKAEVIIPRLRSREAIRNSGWGLSLHAGAFLVAPYVQFHEVHICVSSSATGLRKSLVESLKAERVGREANLVFLDPYYKSSFLFDARILRGVRVVSDLQLYLDLSCFAQRGPEQAEVILERRLRPNWAGK